MIRILNAGGFDDLQFESADDGADTVIRVIGDDESEIYLDNVAVGDVTEDMFIFG